MMKVPFRALPPRAEAICRAGISVAVLIGLFAAIFDSRFLGVVFVTMVLDWAVTLLEGNYPVECVQCQSLTFRCHKHKHFLFDNLCECTDCDARRAIRRAGGI